MRVFDLFPFFNELDLLELRLMELDPVVDVFGLVELPVTFMGLTKPLYFHENKERFSKWLPKIRHFVPAAYPEGPHPTAEWFLRRQLSKLVDAAGPEDLVMLSDVDEIPSRDFVTTAPKRCLEYGTIVAQMDLYYHRIDLLAPFPWNGTIASKKSTLGPEPDFQELRNLRNRLPGIVKGGWHFSWLGSVDQIADKLEASDIVRESELFGGTRIERPPASPAFLERCRNGELELFGRDFRNTEVEVRPGVSHPHTIDAWLERHAHYTKQPV